MRVTKEENPPGDAKIRKASLFFYREAFLISTVRGFEAK
jgi:hypothetical protein